MVEEADHAEVGHLNDNYQGRLASLSGNWIVTNEGCLEDQEWKTAEVIGFEVVTNHVVGLELRRWVSETGIELVVARTGIQLVLPRTEVVVIVIELVVVGTVIELSVGGFEVVAGTKVKLLVAGTGVVVTGIEVDTATKPW